MHSPFSFGPLALAVASFLSIAFGLGLPVDGVVRRNINDEEMGLLQKKDLLCLQDRWLESFETYIDEAYPSCSSFLGIESITTTVPATARTTVTVTSTVTTGIKEVIVTNPTGTLTITAGLVDIDKRQATMAAITPAASIFSSCDESPEDMSLLSTVSSACSCLLISPAVVTATSTTLTTRTLRAIDYREATSFSTVFGQATTTVTVLPSVASLTPSSSSVGQLPSNGSGTSTASTVSSSPVGLSIPSLLSPLPTSSGFTTTIPTLSLTSLPSVGPSNSTLPTTSPAEPSQSSPPLGNVCPAINGSTYTTRGQTFEILCYVNYPGPTYQGLNEPDLRACIDDCAKANVGFSQIRCFAASYYPNTRDSQNCFFRALTNSRNPFYDPVVISAFLLNSTASSNFTSSADPTISPSGSVPTSSNFTTIPTAFSSVNGTRPPSILPSAPLTPAISSGIFTISLNLSSTIVPSFSLPITSTPSGLPSLSVNVSSVFPTAATPSGLPVASANVSSLPSLIIPSQSENRSTAFPTFTSQSPLFTGPSNLTSIPAVSSTPRITSTPTRLPSVSLNGSPVTTPPFNPPTVIDRNVSSVGTWWDSADPTGHFVVSTIVHRSTWTVITTYDKNGDAWKVEVPTMAPVAL